MTFKKKVINTSIEAIQEAEKRAKKKISILNSAVAEAGKHIEVTYLKKFSEDFMNYNYYLKRMKPRFYLIRTVSHFIKLIEMTLLFSLKMKRKIKRLMLFTNS